MRARHTRSGWQCAHCGDVHVSLQRGDACCYKYEGKEASEVIEYLPDQRAIVRFGAVFVLMHGRKPQCSWETRGAVDEYLRLTKQTGATT